MCFQRMLYSLIIPSQKDIYFYFRTHLWMVQSKLSPFIFPSVRRFIDGKVGFSPEPVLRTPKTWVGSRSCNGEGSKVIHGLSGNSNIYIFVKFYGFMKMCGKFMFWGKYFRGGETMVSWRMRIESYRWSL